MSTPAEVLDARFSGLSRVVSGPVKRDVSLFDACRRWVTEWCFFGSGIVVVVAAGGAVGTVALAGLSVPWSAVVAMSAGAFAAYVLERNLIRSDGDAVNHFVRCIWSDRRAGILWLWIGISTAASVWAMLTLSAITLLLCALEVALVVIYFRSRRWRLPAVWGGIGKSAVIASAWGIATAAIPLVEAGADASHIVWLTVYRLIYFLPAVVLPDLADVPGDSLTGRRTIAAAFGKRGVVAMIVAIVAALSAAPLFVSRFDSSVLFAVDMMGLWIVALFIWMGAGTNVSFVRRTVDVLAAWPLVTYVATFVW